MRTNIRADGRVAGQSIAYRFGRIGGITEKTPASAETDRGRGRTDKEFDMGNATAIERQRIAGEYLTRARDDLERAARTRIYYVVQARKYGMTNEAIGALLGISESAVRALVKRYGGES